MSKNEKLYLASVREKGSRKIQLIHTWARSKKQAAEDCRLSGYKVRIVTTDEDFDKDVEKFAERQERAATNYRYMKQIRKEVEALMKAAA